MATALALLFAVAWLQYALVTTTFHGIPADVSDIRVLEWRDDAPPVPVSATIDRRGPDVAITTAARASVVVLFRKEREYLVDGPSSWTTGTARTLTDGAWRRSVRGTVPPGVPRARVEWASAETRAGAWPRCIRAGAEWECWGIGPSDSGVVTMSAEGRLWWTAPPLVEGWRSAAWGRMVRVRDSGPSPVKARLTFARAVTPSASRFAGIRLDTAVVTEAGVVFLQPDVAWTFGEQAPAKAWMEVRSESGGPIFVSLEELAAGGVAIPLEVRLPEARTIAGTVTGPGGQPAAKALVTLFRLIDPQSPPGSPVLPRRVFAAEQTADERGEFAIAGRGEASYEIVAWHPQLGRSSRFLEEDRDRVSITLEAAGIVRGRVVSRGKPLEGIEVVSVPDAETMTQTRDITEVKGGDAKTGSDGRFVVALASTGGGELRIGGGAFAIRRVPLPRAKKTTTELGDIELEEPIELLIVVAGDPGCTLQGVGPIGKIGLQVVTAVRDSAGLRLVVPEPGLWQVGLACAAGRRWLLPDSIQITRAMAGTVVQFAVR